MVFYFSGTGNTRWAAEQLAAATGERLLFIPDELKGTCRYTLTEGERIGFCFPVHGWQPPHIVRQFIKRLAISTSEGQPPLASQPSPSATRHYCYALVTYGDSAGRCLEMLNRELAVAGLQATGLFGLRMPESYVCLPFMYTDSPAREHEKLETSARELEHFADLIRRRVSDQRHFRPGYAPWAYTHLIGRFFNGCLITDSAFTVDAERCIHCGRCAQVCPTGNIALVSLNANDRPAGNTRQASSDAAQAAREAQPCSQQATKDAVPAWKHDGNCTSCLACYHYCPRHAINCGPLTHRRGQYYFGHK